MTLLGEFSLDLGNSDISLPMATQRVLAYLALKGRAHRSRLADDLWPQCSHDRRSSNLRTALWRGRQTAPWLFIARGPRVELSEHIAVDILAHRQPPADNAAGRAVHLSARELISDFAQELLPNWNDDWLVDERAQWNHERLHLLELYAAHWLSDRELFAALLSASTAVSIDPLRESAHRIVMEVHAAEGNHAAALRQYERYRAAVGLEHEVPPSPHMSRLLRELQV